MRARTIPLAATLAALCAGAGGSAAYAAPSTVSTCTTAALQAAVAAGGDWVFGCDGTIFTKDPPPASGSPPDTQFQQPFALSPGETLTLDANGHSVAIDGNSFSRLFLVPAGAVLRMRGLTLADGAFLGDGTLLHRPGGLPGATGHDGGPGGPGPAGSGAAHADGGNGGTGSSPGS